MQRSVSAGLSAGIGKFGEDVFPPDPNSHHPLTWSDLPLSGKLLLASNIRWPIAIGASVAGVDLYDMMHQMYPGDSALDVWKNLPLSAKFLLVGGGTAAAGAAGLGAYQLLQKRRKKNVPTFELGPLFGKAKAKLA